LSGPLRFGVIPTIGPYVLPSLLSHLEILSESVRMLPRGHLHRTGTLKHYQRAKLRIT
jgi:hypothetical protein